MPDSILEIDPSKLSYESKIHIDSAIAEKSVEVVKDLETKEELLKGEK